MMQWVFLYIHILYIWRYIQVPRNKFLEEFDILWNCWVKWIGQLYSWYIAKLLSILPVFLYPNQHQELSHFMVTHLDSKTGTFTFSFPFQRTSFFFFFFLLYYWPYLAVGALDILRKLAFCLVWVSDISSQCGICLLAWLLVVITIKFSLVKSIRVFCVCTYMASKFHVIRREDLTTSMIILKLPLFFFQKLYSLFF